MDLQQEREVARGLRQGRSEAWRTLYDAYAERVWQLVARLMGGESADVADAVQETFLSAARSARSFDPDRGSPWVWLSGIARRQVALYYRKHRQLARLESARQWLGRRNGELVRWLTGREQGPVEVLLAAELALLVRSTLTGLPSGYGTLLASKYIDGATIEEIATAEGCSPVSIHSKLARARRAFRKAFAKTSACSNHDHGRVPHES